MLACTTTKVLPTRRLLKDGLLQIRGEGLDQERKGSQEDLEQPEGEDASDKVERGGQSESESLNVYKWLDQDSFQSVMEPRPR